MRFLNPCYLQTVEIHYLQISNYQHDSVSLFCQLSQAVLANKGSSSVKSLIKWTYTDVVAGIIHKSGCSQDSFIS